MGSESIVQDKGSRTRTIRIQQTRIRVQNKHTSLYNEARRKDEVHPQKNALPTLSAIVTNDVFVIQLTLHRMTPFLAHFTDSELAALKRGSYSLMSYPLEKQGK